ncbi:MAG TPA: DUF2071 domain-containing protein [Pyrinomonadaceae bacterium]|jgi:hypothetical protein|nr:DUF2071 domain-containing protein [Pyrinomonadaceae bacterium]
MKNRGSKKAKSGTRSDTIDRLSIREHPEAMPIMHQNWGKLLFMHWPIEAEALRPLIPERLTIDTFEGEAWIAITPFTMWGVRPVFTPPVPFLSELHETNVRTYVHLDGVPGVWFFSLDANSTVAVLGARTFFHLPYFNAEIELEEKGDRIDYGLRRTDEPRAKLEASWTVGEPMPDAEPGSLEFFLTERYCLYSEDGSERLYRARIHHPPWPLQEAELNALHSTMIESQGLPTPEGEPLLHYAEALAVDIWPLEKV